MRLQFNPTHEIFFKKTQDQKMKGQIQMTNSTSDTIFAYKIKCTEPDLFTVNPLKGSIKAGQNLIITFITNDPVNLQYARRLVSKHKFLIQFTPLTSQHATPNFKSQQSDRKKYYINMDSIRGSQLLKDPQKMSIRSGITNKDSYISMRNRQNQVGNRNNYLTPQKFPDSKVRFQGSPDKNGEQHEQLHQKYSKLKQQLQDLHRQRQEIVNKMSSSKKTSSLNIKKIIVFIVCLLIGYFLGNFTQKVVQDYRLQVQQQKKKVEQSKPWNIFSIFDFLYDQVDPQQV